MAPARVLITGGTGLLGLNWACALRDSHDIVLATHVRRVDLARTRAIALTLEDANALARDVEALAPSIIVHAAGLTNVDECEREPERARHVYEDLSRNVARAAARTGARLVHISTDHLFSGERTLYAEDAEPQPLNAYARAKLAAERAVARECPDALIVRTNFIAWGPRHHASFVDWIRGALADGRPLTMFEDVFITPILADRLAFTVQRLLDAGATGIFNVVGDERISKYDFAVRFAEFFGFSKALLQRGKIAASKLAARRPLDMSLDNEKTRSRLGDASLGTVSEYLEALRRQEREGRRDELMKAVLQ